MGKIQEYLTPEWLEARLAATKAWHVPQFAEVDTAMGRSPDQSIKIEMTPEGTHDGKDRIEGGEAVGVRPDRDTDLDLLNRLISRCITLCECEYALGSIPGVIRDHCRNTCEWVIPYLRALDFSMKHVRYEDRLLPSSAKRLAEKYGGTWWKATGQYAGAEYSFKNQPLHLWTRLDLWFIAAVSGSADLARTVASEYQATPATQLDSYEAREGILRCALARDAEGEELLAGKLKAGYPADYPPQLIDLPLGVIRRDAAMILQAVRRMGTKFKGKWDAKKHRAWYDKRQPRDLSRRHREGTWEECLARTKEALLAGHWVLSWWATAWLEIARQRGMTEIFDPKNRNAFSEWVPFSLG
jgi:hypothetical protein